jgi:general transcription factor 3C protein 4
MLNETAADISKEGAQLSTLLKSLVQSAGGTIPMLSAQPVSDSSAANREVSAAEENVQGIVGVLDEICPACGLVVPLEDVTSAKCKNGHFWQRCSVTTFILSTPWIRTCVGCCRKAFLPPSALDGDKGQELPMIARGWVVEELLEAVKKCLFCGNGFVGIL